MTWPSTLWWDTSKKNGALCIYGETGYLIFFCKTFYSNPFILFIFMCLKPYNCIFFNNDRNN